jgi:PadR family transcriptional regulator PadR
MFFTRWSGQRINTGFVFHGEVRPCSQLHQPDTEASQIAEIHLSDRVLQDEGRVRDGEHIVGADSTLHYAAFLPLGRIFAESSPRYFRRAYRNRVARYKERYGRGVPLITTQAIGEELGYSYFIIYFFVYIDEMRERNYLGEFELILLLTLIRLGDEAYGVPLSRELALMRGRDVSIGSVYAALDRLELKGLVASSLGESTPERGGRAKRYFRVTEQGLRSVHETRKVLSKLWKSLPSVKEDLA